jgi:N6-L-threonylcarbamoyladenine synthase
MHLEAIVPVVAQALQSAELSFEQVDGVAVTQGPGLVGALLVGFSFAKALAYAQGKPWTGVDHLEGHLQSVRLSADPPVFPYVALLASGGHTGIYYLPQQGRSELLGQTRDDAAGEAYDKVANLLGLGYPGGAAIDNLARQGDPRRVHFTRPFLDKAQFDFSFSGIKTAVQRYIQTHPQTYTQEAAHIAAGFQEAVVDVLVHKLLLAAEIKICPRLALVGGVAANQHLRQRLTGEAGKAGLKVHIPPLSLCGDNAAMIAATGYTALQAGRTTPLGADVYSRSRRISNPAGRAIA